MCCFVCDVAVLPCLVFALFPFFLICLLAPSFPFPLSSSLLPSLFSCLDLYFPHACVRGSWCESAMLQCVSRNSSLSHLISRCYWQRSGDSLLNQLIPTSTSGYTTMVQCPPGPSLPPSRLPSQSERVHPILGVAEW